MKVVNQPVRKKDAMALVTGKPVFTDDLAPKDCLIVKLLRSPHANAMIRSIKTDTAKLVPGIQGVVADLIQVNKDYEIAIETALGGSIQNIVTDNEQTAKTLIEFLKKNRYGRATFLPMSSISPRGEFTPREALREPGVHRIG